MALNLPITRRIQPDPGTYFGKLKDVIAHEKNVFKEVVKDGKKDFEKTEALETVFRFVFDINVPKLNTDVELSLDAQPVFSVKSKLKSVITALNGGALPESRNSRNSACSSAAGFFMKSPFEAT